MLGWSSNHPYPHTMTEFGISFSDLIPANSSTPFDSIEIVSSSMRHETARLENSTQVMYISNLFHVQKFMSNYIAVSSLVPQDLRLIQE